MRKHIDYFYKCFDKQSQDGVDRIMNERFNEYGYNFDSNRKKMIDTDAMVSKTNYKYCQKRVNENRKGQK